MNTEIQQNYYEILDLRETATPQEIRLAYEKARNTYSEENKALSSVFSNEEAAELRLLIEEAYQALKQMHTQNVYETRMQAGIDEVSIELDVKSEDNLNSDVTFNIETPQFIRIEPPQFNLHNSTTEIIFAEPATEPAPQSFTTDSLIAEPEQLVTAVPSAVDDLVPTEEEASDFSEAPVINSSYEHLIANKRDWNGDDLKKVREYRKLSFDELTDITKINPWYIAALEKMDPANLPVEVFVRGYVLQVAKALGLKEKVVADSYMRQFRKKIEN